MKKNNKKTAAKNNWNVPAILHGEAMIFHSSLPESARKIKTTNNKYHIIADSETTGNHHVIELNDSVQFFDTEDGRMFMVNEKPTSVTCLQQNRHGRLALEPNCWEIQMQQEYDYFAEHMRNVRD